MTSDEGHTGHEFDDPDTSKVARLLLDVEAHHEKSGWGTIGPTLYIAFNRHGNLAICPLALDRDHPRPILVGLAHAATTRRRWPEIAHYYPAPPLAHLYIADTMPHPPADADEVPAPDPGADLPVRTGLAVGNTSGLVLTRYRGHEPELRTDTGAPSTVVSRALRQLHTGAVRSYLATITGSSTS